MIRKAVILAAGLGTRMLPIAHAVPKEMLPVVDRPAMEYLIAEAADAGITDILVITGRGKGAMEDYFDFSPEYDMHLRRKGRNKEADALMNVARRVNVFFLRQKEALGTGHAVLCAESFTAGEPFAVMYGDDLIFSPKNRPVIGQLMDAYYKHGLGTCGVKEVPDELVMKYCTLDTTKRPDGTHFVRDMIEKPSREQIITNFSILGRLILPDEIYDILRRTPNGANNELQLTDAMGTLARTRGMTAVDFDGTRYDMGSKLGLLQANVTAGASHPETSEEFVRWLKEFAASL